MEGRERRSFAAFFFRLVEAACFSAWRIVA
jgi:hypothetical protein